MKTPLSALIFLFLLTSFFTGNAYSQALPDPGKDPIQPVDSVSQSNTLKPAASKTRETIYVTGPIALLESFPGIVGDSLPRKQRSKEAGILTPLTKKGKTFTPATGIANY